MFVPLTAKDTSIIKNEGRLKKDSILAAKIKAIKEDPIKQDSIKADLLHIFPEWQRIQVMSNAKNDITGILGSIRSKKEEMDNRYKNYNLHILSLHSKYALAFSCIILFFVGAPLGAIIRKGGLGLPMIFAIVLFLIYYFIGVFAGNYAKEGNINPILGAWLSTLIMLPLGILFTKSATEDKGMMNFGVITDFFQMIFKKLKKKKVDDNENAT